MVLTSCSCCGTGGICDYGYGVFTRACDDGSDCGSGGGDGGSILQVFMVSHTVCTTNYTN